MTTAITPNLNSTSAKRSASNSSRAFTGTDNPRHLRAIQAAIVRPISREQLDREAGCSNGPDLVAELRRRGLDFPCTRSKKQDRDLFDCYPGVYYLTDKDRRRLNDWMRRRAAGKGLS